MIRILYKTAGLFLLAGLLGGCLASPPTVQATEPAPPRISIEIPDSFAFEPYAEPALTPVEDFAFGGYFLFGKYAVDSITAEMIPIFDYAFMGRGVDGLREGNGLYALLNSSYAQNYRATNDLQGFHSGGLYPTQDVVNFFYQSRVAYISENGERVVNISVIDGGKADNGWPIWDQQIDIYHVSQKEYSMRLHEWIADNDFPWYLYNFQSYVNLFDLQGNVVINQHKQVAVINNYDEGSVYTLPPDKQMLSVPNNTNHLLLLDLIEQELSIYSLEAKRVLYVINLPENAQVEQYWENELLITFRNPYGSEAEYFYTYLVNLQTLDMQMVGRYLTNPIVSPDQKWVAYAKPYGPGSHEYATEENRLHEMQNGFYIANIETGDTTFYALPETAYGCEAVGWTEQAGLLGLLEQLRDVR